MLKFSFLLDIFVIELLKVSNKILRRVVPRRFILYNTNDYFLAKSMKVLTCQ